MAFATALKKTVSDGVNLTLSQDEAETLRLILGHVGGSTHDTPRKHTDAVMEALKAAGIRTPATKYNLEGVLRFKSANESNPSFAFDPYTLR